MSNTTTTAVDPNIIMLKNVRLSFPNLFKPRAIEEGKEPKYSASLILDKEKHKALITSIEKATDRVALDFFKKKVPLKRQPLRDGNEYADKDGYGDEVMFISASDTRRPLVVDRDRSPITEEDGKVYGGCYVNATIRLFAYEHKTGGKGVSAALRGVQFVADGDSFGAAPVNAETEFEDVSTDTEDY